ncbi:hypothetical protein AB0K89_26020, partial [Streptomyces cinnamoneus]
GTGGEHGDTFNSLTKPGRISGYRQTLFLHCGTASAAEAAGRALVEGPDALPAPSAPLLDITAEQHAAWPVRLFAT